MLLSFVHTLFTHRFRWGTGKKGYDELRETTNVFARNIRRLPQFVVPFPSDCRSRQTTGISAKVNLIELFRAHPLGSDLTQFGQTHDDQALSETGAVLELE